MTTVTFSTFTAPDWHAYYVECARSADRQAARAMRMRRPRVAREWRKMAADLRESASKYSSWPA